MSDATLKLATILQNPGEPAIRSRYQDPRQLRELGYNGLVLYETIALSGVSAPDDVVDPEMRLWVADQFERVADRIERARRAGLAVYLCYDVMSLARRVFEQSASEMACRDRPGAVCPASPEALARCLGALEGLLSRLPAVDGVVVRFGDSDAGRLSYLVGNDIYQPACDRCRGLDAAQRVCNVLKPMRRLVVDRLGLRLIVRTWNVRPGGMHDSVELCRRVADRFGGPSRQQAVDDRMVWSFKFTQTDFWRYQQWNEASVEASALGRWPIIYELQCQREFEGKGGIPNWQAPLWRDGAPECGGRGGGLAAVADRVTLAGLWAWVRGGGWGGPFVDSESWIDANVFAVPRLADQPNADVDALARQWITQRLRVDQPAVSAVIERVLLRSPRVVLQALYIQPYATTRTGPWNPNGRWIQDDLIDVQAAWQIVQQLDLSQLDRMVAEKTWAVEQVAADRAALQQLLDDDNRLTVDPLINTLLYTESLLAMLRDLFAGLAAFRQHLVSDDAASAKRCRQCLLGAQSWWNHHTQRHAALPATATAFRESHFWELTQQILARVGATEGVV